MKKTVHIISHSHWDREWYLPYEQHHMRLIELLDGVIACFETDPDFKHFHLDGQTISLDDYLQVRPQQKDTLARLIREGKLNIGPFYILQDDYLISAEANTRNMLVGLAESKKWGTPVKVGYFPDTFGNMGQAPQMMAQGGLQAIAFGRGVKTTGFNNLVVDEAYSSKYSEINWQGSDGTQMLSILFANWYSNGNEIPVEPARAQTYWDKKLADAERYASTSQLLFMNGVDHQPVQKDVTQAIRVANALYPEYTFIHSSFDAYIAAVQAELKDDVEVISGELTSQETDGWYTLTNTASSRIYLKQNNVAVQNTLERVSEPLAAMAAQVSEHYPHDQLTYGWKRLMQNHPHDSICGCGVDSIHRSMMARFEDAKEVANFVRDESLRQLSLAIDTSAFDPQARTFTIFNTDGFTKTQNVEVVVEWERIPFNDNKPQENYRLLEQKQLPDFDVVDDKGRSVPFEILATTIGFNYDLPKDAFRRPYMAKTITLRLNMTDMAEYSWQTFALIQAKSQNEKPKPTPHSNTLNCIENERFILNVSATGEVNVEDKKHGKKHHNIFYYENTGDIGNEYIYCQSADYQAITSQGLPTTVMITTNTDLKKELVMTQTMMIPQAADDLLHKEQQSVTEMRERKAKRSQTLLPHTITTHFILEKNNPIIKIQTHFTNQAKDHRLRAVFKTGVVADTHVAESVYEIIERPNDVSKSWQNPSNPQRAQSFVAMHDSDKAGMIVGNIGLHEYEVCNHDTIALTLHRGTGEMGDWGYFPTPQAQCLGAIDVSYALSFYEAIEQYDIYRAMRGHQVAMVSVQSAHHGGVLKPTHQFLKITAPTGMVTAMKCAENSNRDVIVRLYNMALTDASLAVDGDFSSLCNTDLIESSQSPITTTLKPAEIRTVRCHYED